MMYVEAGTPPLIVKIKTKVLIFCICDCDEINKYTKKILNIIGIIRLLKLHVSDVSSSHWLILVKTH